jgi:hypothetical protein
VKAGNYECVVCYHLLGHPWVQVGGLALDKSLDSAILSRVTQFSAMNKLKKMTIQNKKCITWTWYPYPHIDKELSLCITLRCLKPCFELHKLLFIRLYKLFFIKLIH